MDRDEEKIARALRFRFSDGSEQFRDDLLDRCLRVLDADDAPRALEDDELELLAAAGSPYEGLVHQGEAQNRLLSHDGHRIGGE